MRRLSPVLALSLALAGAAWASAETAGFLPVQTLPGPGVSPRESALRLVGVADGEVIAVAAGSSGIVEPARRSRALGAWTEGGRLPGDAAPPALAASRGAVLGAWLRGGAVVVSTRDRTTRRWSAPEQVSDGGASDVTVAAGTSGDLAVAWIRDGAVQVRVRYADSGEWTPTASLSAAGSGSSASRAALVVDPAGVATLAWVETSGGRESGGPAVVRVAGRAPGASAWAPAETLSLRRDRPASAPHVGADAAGTLTVAWVEDGALVTASRTSSSQTWTSARHELLDRADPDPDRMALAVDPSGRAVLAALAPVGPDLVGLRLFLRDGSASGWSDLGTGPSARPARPLAVVAAMTSRGDAVVAHTRQRGTCGLTVVAVPAGGDEMGTPAFADAGCGRPQLASAPNGDLTLGSTDRAGVLRTASRPAVGLPLDLVDQGAGRLRARVPVAARLVVEVRSARGLARRATYRLDPGVWASLAVPLQRKGRPLPPGSYRLLARAVAGSATSQTRAVTLLVRG